MEASPFLPFSFLIYILDPDFQLDPGLCKNPSRKFSSQGNFLIRRDPWQALRVQNQRMPWVPSLSEDVEFLL